MAQQVVGPFTEQTAESLSKFFREPDWLTSFRLDSFRQFGSLPLEKSSLYTKYTFISQFDPNQFPLKAEKEKIDFRTFFKDYLTGKEKNILLQGNDQEIHTDLEESLAARGVILMSLHEAISKHESLVRGAMEHKVVTSSSDKYAAFTNAFFNSGTFVYVPKNVVLDQPLRKMLLTSEPKNSIIDQTLIVCEEGSKLVFLEELYSRENKSESLLASVVEIDAQPTANVDFSSLQLLDDNAVYVTNKGVRASNDSRVTASALFLGSKITRSRMNLDMAGRGSFTEGLEIFFTGSKQRYDFESNLLHNAPDSTGSIHARGTLKDESQSIFKGMIKIVNAAKNSRSYLAHHAMIMDRRAKSDGVPSLEIETNEVKATHSASVAQVDEEQVFYLMARGLDEDDAKRMIVLGFFEPVLSRIPIVQTREGARFIIEGKWRGERRKMPDRETLIALTGEAVPEVKQTEDIFERHYKYRK
ncbi:MAG: Fe-S cluster assembly protein SufD [Thaumarchaeota archaeon]|nr:Fe-S cluster assembly protein SufD [Nitrososphaerota archaeon]